MKIGLQFIFLGHGSVSYPDLFLYHWIGTGVQILKQNFLEQGF